MTRSSRTAAGSPPSTTWRRSASVRPTSGGPGRSSTGTDVAVGTVIGFPHGNHLTATKVFEAERGPRRRGHGARHGHPDRRPQVRAATTTCGRTSRRSWTWPMRPGAIVKVIFENAYLTDDEKIRACRLSEAAGADFVKTSTGFAPGGATHDDLRLMRANTSPHIQVKAAGGVRTLDALLEVMALGVDPDRRHGNEGDHRRLPGPQGRPRGGPDRGRRARATTDGLHDGRRAGTALDRRGRGASSSGSPRPRPTRSRRPATGARTPSPATGSSTCSGPAIPGCRSRRCSRGTAHTPASTRWSSCR